ncbi:MAG TPA: prepilin-type N-terminal cleavage/methylation domain-containing protein [Deltaproteobacteria bacterium]|nr:prepilin-type N-terminal cleavage/methylation domain-containing protein [Deltaproteobacteria bacterium]MBW2082750.1 prepilin-type N-terminal cleavage/methylation domain-containing protein [Deltaproteobacteria bacterium]HDH98325.1 prepilin-type N-terminal cleavage/methylation domain-containing protein [Deltaproteobacteria bacterium]
MIPAQTPLPSKRASGFTLLELLVSLTILAIVASLIFGSLKVGIGAWERGERDIDANQRLRAIAELVKAQMASIYAEKRLKLASGVEFFVRGDAKSLEFSSVAPILPKSNGRPVYVKYRVERDEETDSDQLYLRELDLTLLNPKEIEREEDLKADYTLLIKSAKDISFEYLSASQAEKGQEWVKEWKEDKKNSLPMAMKLCILNKRDKSPLCIIARVQAPYGEQ